jgi:peptidoglycan/xylan/chitin deacetylase (PgdA/CDA1 family)
VRYPYAAAVDRRVFLATLAAGTLSALTACTGAQPPAAKAVAKTARTPAAGKPVPLTLPPQTAGSSLPPGPVDQPVAGTPQLLDRLQGGAERLALTVDDGTSTEVLSAYVDFVKASGIRLTFFPNGVYPSWLAVKDKLAPLVESGQVQLGNHTWEHPNITTLSDKELVDQLGRNERFLRQHFGVSGLPFFRPPYGAHNRRTDRITGDLGFTRTVMWWGSLGDSAVLSSEQVLAEAEKWFRPERLVIGHANHPGVTHIYPQLVDIIRTRKLQTVTLRDVFGDLPLDARLASS